MRYYVYIIKSKSTQRYYLGYTYNIKDRLIRHNNCREKSTKFGLPWVLVYKEKFLTKLEALKREKQIKKYKGGKAFKKLINSTKTGCSSDG